jgi:hypothetical protein
MGFYGCIPKFLKNHGSLILSILAGGGVVGTAVASALAAPEAKEKLNKYRIEKVYDRKHEIMDWMISNGHMVSFSEDEHVDLYYRADSEVKLTLGEKIRIAGIGRSTRGTIILSFDGRTHEFSNVEYVEISQSEKEINLIRNVNYDYWKKLSSKLL